MLNNPTTHVLSTTPNKCSPKVAVLWVNVAPGVLASHLYDNENKIPFRSQRSSDKEKKEGENDSKSTVKAHESGKNPVFRPPDPTVARVLYGRAVEQYVGDTLATMKTREEFWRYSTYPPLQLYAPRMYRTTQQVPASCLSWYYFFTAAQLH